MGKEVDKGEKEVSGMNWKCKDCWTSDGQLCSFPELQLLCWGERSDGCIPVWDSSEVRTYALSWIQLQSSGKRAAFREANTSTPIF